jgi:hypothetical protein
VFCVVLGCSQQQGAVALMSGDNQEGQETWDDELTQVQYHTFPLPQSSIIVVDTEESFEHFLDYIKVSAVMIRQLPYVLCKYH